MVTKKNRKGEIIKAYEVKRLGSSSLAFKDQAQVVNLVHGDYTSMVGRSIVSAQYLCRSSIPCNWCNGLKRRIISRTGTDFMLYKVSTRDSDNV